MAGQGRTNPAATPSARARPREATRVERGPQRIGDLIAGVVKAHRIGTDTVLDRLAEAWGEAIGRRHARACRLERFAAGVLTISVETSVLAHELGVYHKPALLNHLRQRTQVSVRDLRFVVAGRPHGSSEGDA